MATIRWINPTYNLDDGDSVYAYIADLDTKLQTIGLIPYTDPTKTNVDFVNKPYPVVTASTAAPTGSILNLGYLIYDFPVGNGVVLFENDPDNIGYKKISNASYDSTPVRLELYFKLYRFNTTAPNPNYHRWCYYFEPQMRILNPNTGNAIINSQLNFAVTIANYGGNDNISANPLSMDTQSYVTLDNEFFAIGWSNYKYTGTSISGVNNTYPWWDFQFAFNRRNGIITTLGYSNVDTKGSAAKPSRFTINENENNIYNVASSSTANISPQTTSINDYHTYRFSLFYSGITGVDLGYYPLYCNDVINNEFYAIPILITKSGLSGSSFVESSFAVKYRGEKVVHKFIKIGNLYGSYSPYNSAANTYTWQIKNETYPCTTTFL